MKKKIKDEKINIEIAFDLNPLARMKAIEDFLFWCYEQELNPSNVDVFLDYKKYLEWKMKKG